MNKKISIEGMSCINCVKHMKEILESIGNNVEVNLEGKYAIVETQLSNEEINEIIDDAGYDIINIEEI